MRLKSLGRTCLPCRFENNDVSGMWAEQRETVDEKTGSERRSLLLLSVQFAISFCWLRMQKPGKSSTWPRVNHILSPRRALPYFCPVTRCSPISIESPVEIVFVEAQIDRFASTTGFSFHARTTFHFERVINIQIDVLHFYPTGPCFGPISSNFKNDHASLPLGLVRSNWCD